MNENDIFGVYEAMSNINNEGTADTTDTKVVEYLDTITERLVSEK